MIEKNKTTRNRIPVHFMDDEKGADGESRRDGETTPAELGRASAYEDETEMQRRTQRGEETDGAGGRARADERDDAGAPPDSELPENREDQDTQPRGTRGASGVAASDEFASEFASRTARPGVSAEVELLAAQAESRLLEDELQKAKGERQELFDLMARRQADFENYRKRMERERNETYNRVAGEVASQILPVLDNLQRAVAAEASVQGSKSKEFGDFLHGVELISRQLSGVLENLGIVPVESVGHSFDPHVHEAIATEQTDEFEPDIITQEIQRGYRIGDKLLRPAMVKVATR
jgi:molecular chaperone GrpE